MNPVALAGLILFVVHGGEDGAVFVLDQAIQEVRIKYVAGMHQ
jgi:hypothetical protein